MTVVSEDIPRRRSRSSKTFALLRTHHLQNGEIGRRQRHLHARRKRNRPERTVRREGHIVRLGHIRQPLRLGNAARVRNVRLQDIDQPGLEERLDVPAVVQPLAQRDGDGRQARQLLQRLRVLDQQRLLDEERAVRLEGAGELLGHGPVQAAVEVEAGVQAGGFDGFEPFDARVDGCGRVEPVDVFGGVHLHAGQALGFAGFAGGGGQ